MAEEGFQTGLSGSIVQLFRQRQQLWGAHGEGVDTTMGDSAQSATRISFPIIPRIRQAGLAACGIVDAGGMDDAQADATFGDI